MNYEQNVTVNRTYMDSPFRMLFKDRKELLPLYNALNDSNYTDESQLEIVTLENAVYIAMKNDLAFILDSCINMMLGANK